MELLEGEFPATIHRHPRSRRSRWCRQCFAFGSWVASTNIPAKPNAPRGWFECLLLLQLTTVATVAVNRR